MIKSNREHLGRLIYTKLYPAGSVERKYLPCVVVAVDRVYGGMVIKTPRGFCFQTAPNILNTILITPRDRARRFLGATLHPRVGHPLYGISTGSSVCVIYVDHDARIGCVLLGDGSLALVPYSDLDTCL